MWYKRDWDINVVNMVVSKLVETRNNSIFMIGYLDEVIKPLILSISQMYRYVKTFKGKSGNNKNYILMSLHINDNNLLEKHKII